MESDVWQYIKKNGLLEERQTVGAAVSGGPDSMALLVCLQRLSQKHDFLVKALHYDHGTRGGASAADAKFVRDFCEKNGIPFLMEASDVPSFAKEHGIGFELAGRLCREAFFHSLVCSGEIDTAATAHHMDDNAESVVMHMARGCGTEGLRGILPRKEGIIRPLLCVTRKQIEEYLLETRTPFVTDLSNEDTSFDRSFVRHEILPLLKERLNGSVAQALFRLSSAASEDEEYLAGKSEEAFRECEAPAEAGACALQMDRLVKFHAAVSHRVIRLAMKKAGRSLDVERNHIEAVLEAARAQNTGKTLDLGQGLEARTEYGRIVFCRRAPEPAPFSAELTFPGDTLLPEGALLSCEIVPECGSDGVPGITEYVDADGIPEGAVIRTRRPGDRIRTLNGPGTRKLKEYFIDRKVPRAERDRTLLLADGSDILWIIGGVLSDRIRVREDTRRICRLHFEKEPAGNAGQNRSGRQLPVLRPPGV